MHAIPHALPHRGTGASRARPRWQPYSSLPSTSSRSPSSSYLNTPQTSVPTPISLETRPIHDPSRSALKQSATLAHPLKDGFVREAHKVRHVNGLVDHAVKSLSEIWNPNDIPAVFSTSSRQAGITSLANNPIHIVTPPHLHNAQNIQHAFTTRYTQLPSPTTPTHPTPVAFPVSIPSVRPAPLERTTTAIFDDPARNNAAPLKSFVHEVLRRSRTSSGVLQTALCYLEAIRHKVPEYVRQEKLGHGTRGEADQSERIIPVEKLEHSSVGGEQPSLDFMDPSCFVNPDYIDSSAATIRIPDIVAIPLATPSEPSTQCPVSIYPPKKPKSENLTPLPPLPSPLLCPRRAFLAALILASKFMQDKCYSNRAWAKLAGLPPREIGRCERALGEALEWRLWVGKLPPSKARSPVSRSASETFRVIGPSESSMLAPERLSMSGPSTLRRAATVPSNVFAPLAPQQPFGFCGPAPMTAYPEMASMSTTSRMGDSIRLPAHGMSTLSDGTPPATPQLYASPSSTDSESSLETLPSEDERNIQIASSVDSPSSPPSAFGAHGQMDYDMAPPPFVSDPTPKAATFAIPNLGNLPSSVSVSNGNASAAFDVGAAGWEWSGRW